MEYTQDHTALVALFNVWLQPHEIVCTASRQGKFSLVEKDGKTIMVYPDQVSGSCKSIAIEPEPNLTTRTLSWTVPTLRENGTLVDELGGYELKYACDGNEYVAVLLDADITSYDIPSYRGCNVILASYDSNGLYSAPAIFNFEETQ